MATALPTNPDLECPICTEMFKTPKGLSCGHTFCLECLKRLVVGRIGTFPCPFCKQDDVIPQGGVDKIATNFSLQNVIDSTSLKQIHVCPNHSKKEVEYFCQTCNLGLCSKCMFKDHNGHKKLDLECDSTREKVVQILSKSEQLIKNKKGDLEKTLATLLEKSNILKSFCNEACTKISEKTEKIIDELKENCENRQKEIRDNFDKNESKLTETRQKVMTQINNITTDLDEFRPTTEEPTLTLIYSLTKLKHLQKLCENMKTDIPPLTYVEWREGSDKVCDILGSTVTKPLNLSSEGTVFRFNYKDFEAGQRYIPKDKYTSHGVVWTCRVLRSSNNGNLLTYIDFLPGEDNRQVTCCEIEYTVTLFNKNKDKNMISRTKTEIFPTVNFVGGDISIPWNELTDPSEGFIDNEGQFFVRFHILQLLDIQYNNVGMMFNFIY